MYKSLKLISDIWLITKMSEYFIFQECKAFMLSGTIHSLT
jgi:hypothetical protein